MRNRETDTPDHVNAMFHRLLMERSAEDRLRMACDMFDTAVSLIIASLPSEVAGDPTVRRSAVLWRLYGTDCGESFLQATLARALDENAAGRR